MPPSSTTISQPTSVFTESLNLLPPNSNTILHITSSSGLYNIPLILISTALLLHSSVFGVILLLRGFSASRALDTQFLTIVFALSLPSTALIFLLNFQIDAFKLFFILDHELIEILLALRVFLSRKVLLNHGGTVFMGSWIGLCVLSIIVASNPRGYGADVVAWVAFISDGLIAAAGAGLVLKFFKERKVLKTFREEVMKEEMIQFWGWKRKEAEEAERKENAKRKRMWERKVVAEGFAGVGFIIHGLSTMTIAPIWTRVLYNGLDPKYFAYAWTVVFGCAFISVALCVPSAAVFFSTIKWCCWHDRKLLPGQAAYSGPDSSEFGSEVDSKSPIISEHKSSCTSDVKPVIPGRHRSRFSNWFSFSAPARRASPKVDPMEQWEKLQQQYIETQARTLAEVQGSFSNSHSRQGSLSAIGKSQPQGMNSFSRQRNGSTANSSITANEINTPRHGRSTTQDSMATMFLPPSPMYPARANATPLQKTHLQTAIPNPAFVFPPRGHTRRGSSLTRLAAIKREQQQAMAIQQQQYSRRLYGSDGSINGTDLKGKTRKRSLSGPAGEAGSQHGNLGTYQPIMAGDLVYWTTLPPRHPGDGVELDGGRF